MLDDASGDLCVHQLTEDVAVSAGGTAGAKQAVGLAAGNGLDAIGAVETDAAVAVAQLIDELIAGGVGHDVIVVLSLEIGG